MPYAIKGRAVVKKNTGKVVGHSKNPKKYIRVLRAIEHGWKPTGKKVKLMKEREKQYQQHQKKKSKK